MPVATGGDTHPVRIARQKTEHAENCDLRHSPINKEKTMKKTLILITPLMATLALGACSTEDGSDIPVQRMSCTDLAREIGKYTQMKQDADIDSVFGAIGMLAADNRDDEIAHGVEGIAGDITAAVAENELDTLKTVYSRKGCI